MMTVIDFFKKFLRDLWTAIKYEGLSYDAKLQMTKTPVQRLLIWLGIIAIIIVFFLLYYFYFGNLILSNLRLK